MSDLKNTLWVGCHCAPLGKSVGSSLVSSSGMLLGSAVLHIFWGLHSYY